MPVSAASPTLDEEEPAVVAGVTGDGPLAAACIRVGLSLTTIADARAAAWK